MRKKGIAVAGNMIVDVLYPIVGHPKPGELTTITDGISRSSGGALCNVIVDLAKLDPDLPLTALGRIGTDVEGGGTTGGGTNQGGGSDTNQGGSGTTGGGTQEGGGSQEGGGTEGDAGNMG